MKHIKTITNKKPAQAQFEGAIQIIAVLSALLSLLGDAGTLFGFDLSKDN